jgi:hypothetical protein
MQIIDIIDVGRFSKQQKHILRRCYVNIHIFMAKFSAMNNEAMCVKTNVFRCFKKICINW